MSNDRQHVLKPVSVQAMWLVVLLSCVVNFFKVAFNWKYLSRFCNCITICYIYRWMLWTMLLFMHKWLCVLAFQWVLGEQMGCMPYTNYTCSWKIMCDVLMAIFQMNQGSPIVRRAPPLMMMNVNKLLQLQLVGLIYIMSIVIAIQQFIRCCNMSKSLQGHVL